MCYGYLYSAYRTNEGIPWVLPVVRAAEKALANDETLNKEYLPVLGLDAFSTAASTMLLGESSPALLEARVCSLCLGKVVYAIYCFDVYIRLLTFWDNRGIES